MVAGNTFKVIIVSRDLRYSSPDEVVATVESVSLPSFSGPQSVVVDLDQAVNIPMDPEKVYLINVNMKFAHISGQFYMSLFPIKVQFE
jgi:hypothetical protein